MGPIETWLSADHSRMDRLLAAACANDTIDHASFEEFRRGLLRHIGMEEKILLPFARERRDGVALEGARALRMDHGLLAKLLVPTPTVALCHRLRQELDRHNRIEEGDDGLYAMCDALAGDDAEAVVAMLQKAPEVPPAKHYDGPLIQDTLAKK
ncbi:MAG: hemerythrin domain-containing protein [Polyangiaceae bacterium]